MGSEVLCVKFRLRRIQCRDDKMTMKTSGILRMALQPFCQFHKPCNQVHFMLVQREPGLSGVRTSVRRPRTPADVCRPNRPPGHLPIPPAKAIYTGMSKRIKNTVQMSVFLIQKSPCVCNYLVDTVLPAHGKIPLHKRRSKRAQARVPAPRGLASCRHWSTRTRF